MTLKNSSALTSNTPLLLRHKIAGVICFLLALVSLPGLIIGIQLLAQILSQNLLSISFLITLVETLIIAVPTPLNAYIGYKLFVGPRRNLYLRIAFISYVYFALFIILAILMVQGIASSITG